MITDRIEDSRHADPQRGRWMSVLAKADWESLHALYTRLDLAFEHELVRAPETGLVMVRGRTGGSGASFNLGEVPVTRCTVRLADGSLGHAYVMGRNDRHAETAAVLDALLQNPVERERIERQVVQPLARAQEDRNRSARAEAAATKVDFFTLVRGEDETS